MTEYTITKSRFGLYTSIKADGTRMVTGETEDGVRFYVPNNLVSINQEQFDIWFNSPYRGKLQKVVEFKN